MTALEKLCAAITALHGINADPHETFIFVGDDPGERIHPMAAPPEREAWQEDLGTEDPEPLTLFDLRCALDEIADLRKREPLPHFVTETDPGKAYLAMLESWKSNREMLAYYKEQEGEQRRILFAGAFANPVEGVQRHTLPDGRKIKGKYKINRKIDEAALPATLAAMREAGVANTDALVTYKPFLAKREWNTLSQEMKLLFSTAVIATPGMPGLDIELPKAGKR